MANITKSPRFTLKIKTRDAVNKIKSGSPKFQEVLRQRCRERMREKRSQLFDKKRGVASENHDEGMINTLTEIVRKEFSDLTTMNIDKEIIPVEFSGPLSQDEILELEGEILADEEEWILQEYAQLMEEDNEMFNKYIEEIFKDSVICPMCEKSSLNETPNGLICPGCNLCLPPNLTLCQLSIAINNQLDAHSTSCPGQISFMTLPENNSLSLYLTCETCQCLSLIQ